MCYHKSILTFQEYFMKTFMKKIALILCLSLLLSVFAACTQESAETTAATTENTADLTEITTEETTEHRETTVVVTTNPVTETEEMTTASITEEGSTTIVISTETESVSDTETTLLTEADTEETTESQILDTEEVEDLVSFVDYVRSSSRSYYDLLSGDIAVSFTVPDGYLKTLYLNITDKGSYTECSVDVSIYVFDGKYNSSVESEPIYNEYITTVLRTHKINFEDGKIGAGDYLMVVSYVDVIEETLVSTDPSTDGEEISDETDTESNSESENETEKKPETPVEEAFTKVISDKCWIPKSSPDEYDAYNLKSYVNGKHNKNLTICGGIVVSRTVVVEKNEETEEKIENVENDDTVKVILLGGQSNATGASVNSYLRNHVSEEDYEKYLHGFENVKIYYVNGSTSGGFHITTTTDEFVTTKLGQGYRQTNFGPELGLAEYLSETYPDETFYIIKYAIGGSALFGHWNSTDENYNKCLVEFKETVNEGLALLEDEGYDPQIVAFLWMQGEADASTMYRAHEYYDLQKALVEDIREEYDFYAPKRGIAFVDAAISDSGLWATWFMVNECKIRYSMESNMNFYVDTNAHSLTTLYENNDLAHYDSASMLLLGRLYGEMISEIID